MLVVLSPVLLALRTLLSKINGALASFLDNFELLESLLDIGFASTRNDEFRNTNLAATILLCEIGYPSLHGMV